MSKRLIITSDSHTQGEPTRLVIGGVIHYPGKTMREKQQYVARELDVVRRSLMSEPRGHHDMFGGFITEPATDTGDLGIIFMDNQGYLNMCGHGTIGLCTTVVELGLVTVTPPRTEIHIDSPAGRVEGYAITENGRVVRAGFQNVPAFCLSAREKLQVEGIGEVEVGIAYGGNFFAILPAESVGLRLEIDNQLAIRTLGTAIKRAANEQLMVQHPQMPDVGGVDIVTFYGAAVNPGASYRNVHVFANGQVDRSPGGTGTSAMLAYLIAIGEITPEMEVTSEGLAGGCFKGKIVRQWGEGGVTFYTPDISGVAHMTGIHYFTLDTDDPMLAGLVREPQG
ncbi:MAG: proline racemase family protein [Anaerolineae bacterium]|nr:proline racemase family protein [Anaerolineae bacterium]